MKKLLGICIGLSMPFIVSGQEMRLEKLDSADFFNFWEGTWEGTWSEGESQGKAINILTWMTGGKVLQENFEIVEGQNKGFKGTSISVFRPLQNVWKQAWADNQGGYFDFTGRFENDDRIFQTCSKRQGNQVVIQRMVFRDIRSDAFTWDWERSVDDGKSWSLNWQIRYVRLLPED